MTEEQIHETIRRMIQLCEVKMASGKYPMVSARSALKELGFDGNELQAVLEHIAAGGFDYCLDPAIPMTGHHEARGERPHRDVCYWGPDQLASRLQSLSNVPYWVRHSK